MTFKGPFAAIISSVVLCASVISCSMESPSVSKQPETLGTRSYKLDPGAAAIAISVYGTVMGTPDLTKFAYLMRTFKNSGELSTLTEKDPGIEGGATICGVFSAGANREALYDVVRSVETDNKATNLTATSVSSCSN